MKKPIYLILLSIILVVALLITGCRPAARQEEPVEQEDPADPADPAEEELEPYTFTHYFNYTWWGLQPWGVDEVSKYQHSR
jgi:hypothetical protein